MVRAALSQGTKNDALEASRAVTIAAMKSGDKVLFDFADSTPDMQNEWTDDVIFKSDLVFNRQEWYKLENYMKYVRNDESYAKGGVG